MRKFAILTDTGSDLPESYYGEHEVGKIGLGFTMDGVTYGEEEAELDVKEFYARLRAGAMPKTFQVTPEQAVKHIEPYAAAGRDVLVVAFSSGLSGTYLSYLTAAKELMTRYSVKIAVVDSLCASYGQGLLVDYIVRKADMGAEIDETVAYAEGLKRHICHIFTVEDLYHLKRGGRVTGAEAFMGTVLNIKPILHVDDEGHLIPMGKVMGRKKSISALVDRMNATQILEPDDPIYISHGDCEDDVAYLIKLLRRDYGDRPIFVNMIGSVIGAHSGSGTLAVFYRGSRR